jgi:hypothetical protein
MSKAETSITRIDDNKLISVVQSVKERLLVMAPGLSTKLASVISEKWVGLGSGSVNIILDVDPEVYRLGYGTLDALKLLEKTARELGTLVNHQPGIRIGLIVADENAIVYAPTPELVEAGSTQPTHPNGIVLGTIPKHVEEEVGLGENGVIDQVVGLEKVPTKKVEDVSANLESNPPVKFDVARKVRVFNAQFEFVEFEVSNVLISRRTVPIPSDLMGLANDEKTERLLKSSFRLIEDDDELSGSSIMTIKQCIVDKYLITLPGFGVVILRTNKQDFEDGVEVLRRFMRMFQRKVTSLLQAKIDANKNALTKALAPAVKSNPPKRWTKYLGVGRDANSIQRLLEKELERAFGSAEKVVGKMHVSVLFKGVTYELLNDAKFIETARKAIPSIPFLHEEYDAAKEAV